MSTETVPGTGRPAAELDASIDELAINTIRTLAMDAVQAANSGHPGTPMALAPVAYTLWQQFLRYDPDDPIWPDRDRFVLSCGHASMLLYSLLHLAGVKAVNPAYERLGELAVPLDDIKRFRQLDSALPGPPGVPLDVRRRDHHRPARPGRGDSVGMAIAGDWLAAHFNRPGFELFDYNVYAHVQRRRHDGGHLVGGRLARRAPEALEPLLDLRQQPHHDRGQHDLAFSEDVATRFIGYGWNVTRVGDANDREMLGRAFETFKSESRAADADHRRQPHRLRRADQAGHRVGARRAARRGGDPAHQEAPTAGRRTRSSSSPTACASTSRPASASAAGRCARRGWKRFERYQEKHPELADQLAAHAAPRAARRLGHATSRVPARRQGPGHARSSGKVLNAIAKNLPVAASAARPTSRRRPRRSLTFDGAGDFERRQPPAAATSTSAFASTRWARSSTASRCRSCAPYGSGFLIFCDYGRAPIRLSALMEMPTIHVFTHDSIGVGEDGPTHQPIEQLASLRAIPGADHDPARATPTRSPRRGG